MKNLKDIISEKLVINKNIKVGQQIDYESPEDILKIYKGAYISILFRTHSYIENSTFRKKLYKVDYKDIVDVLNIMFDYKISYDEAKIRKGHIWEIITNSKDQIEKLITGYSIIFKYDKNVTLSGKEIQKEYKDIIDIKK